jgi:uncharacterized protein YjbJ (UPF0337 family)
MSVIWNLLQETGLPRYERAGALGNPPLISCIQRGNQMDKDRIKGAAKQAKGTAKEVAGKLTGDAKLKAEGKADKAAGRTQNAIGGLKDTLRGR